MSKEKKRDELHEEVEAVDEKVSGSEDEQEVAEDGSEVVEEAPDLEKELADAVQQAADLRDQMLRAAAENENFKKRIERERSASLKYAGEQIFREMLPVVDNLERAIGQGVVDGVDAEKNLAALIEGVELTLKSLVSTLEKFEVKPVASVGEVFDPKHHEALTMEASESVPASHIVTEFEKGYYYKDRMLRAAKVIVSSGKAEADSKE